jgi:hypothetical protein
MTDSSRQPRAPLEEIAGLVELVTFFNEDSGFAVLQVEVRGQRELVTVLGSVPAVSAGEWLTAKELWVRDKEHGLQFKAQVLKATWANHKRSATSAAASSKAMVQSLRSSAIALGHCGQTCGGVCGVVGQLDGGLMNVAKSQVGAGGHDQCMSLEVGAVRTNGGLRSFT